MTIKSYRDLECWQLGVQLRNETLAFVARRDVARDLKFCDQLTDAARSAPANIAEGFGRSSRQFHRYLDIAIGSLQEFETHIDEALTRRCSRQGSTNVSGASRSEPA
jgi:four helix bundle protein